MVEYVSSLGGKHYFDPTPMFMNLVDAILMGVPSSMIVPEIAKDYDIEIADLNRIYNQLNKELNNLSDVGISLSDAKNEIKEAMYQSGPLGAIRANLSDKYKAINRSIDNNRAEIEKKTAELRDTSNKIADAQRRSARSSSIGGAWRAGDI